MIVRATSSIIMSDEIIINYVYKELICLFQLRNSLPEDYPAVDKQSNMSEFRKTSMDWTEKRHIILT